MGGEVAVVPVDKLGYSEDASSEVGDASKEEDVVEGGPSVKESLAGRGVTGRPDHVTGATVANTANSNRRSLGSKLSPKWNRRSTHDRSPNQTVKQVKRPNEMT